MTRLVFFRSRISLLIVFTSCVECQLTSQRGVSRAKLQPVPIIATPFEIKGMDIVGPLEKTQSGKMICLLQMTKHSSTTCTTTWSEYDQMSLCMVSSIAFSVKDRAL